MHSTLIASSYSWNKGGNEYAPWSNSHFNIHNSSKQPSLLKTQSSLYRVRAPSKKRGIKKNDFLGEVTNAGM